MKVSVSNMLMLMSILAAINAVLDLAIGDSPVAAVSVAIFMATAGLVHDHFIEEQQ